MESTKQNSNIGNSKESNPGIGIVPETWMWLNTEPELTQASDEDDHTDEAALNASDSPSELDPSQEDHISGTVTAYYGDLPSGEDLGDDIWLNEDPMEEVQSKMETLQMGPSQDTPDFHNGTELLNLTIKKEVGESGSTEKSEKATEQSIPVMDDSNTSQATGEPPQIPAALPGPSSDSSVQELLRQLQEYSDRMLDIVKNLRAVPGTAVNVEGCYYALNSLKLAAAEVDKGDDEGSN